MNENIVKRNELLARQVIKGLLSRNMMGIMQLMPKRPANWRLA